MHWPVIAFDEIDSTNQEAQRRVAAANLAATWLTAKRQTAGRGRSGRNWQSNVGNLFASLLVPLECPPNVLHHLSLVCGVALHNAILSCCAAGNIQADVRLKWPNDVLINEAKTAGILVESSIIGDRAVAVMGFGLNLQSTPDIEDRKTTMLAEHGLDLSPEEFLQVLDQALFETLGRWSNGTGFDQIRQSWLDHSFALGHPISINSTAGRASGAFAGLDDDGALLIRTTGDKIEIFHFGDVDLGAGTSTVANGETRNT